jgi:gliding motility-associated-like protein
VLFSSNCRDTSRTIAVNALQGLSGNTRYPDVNTTINTNLLLEARSLPGSVYQWTPSLGLNNANIPNPVFNFNNDQQYLIRITSPQGCSVTDTLVVRIFTRQEIYIPDAFSPNWDGINDILIPRLSGIASLIYFKVYDRWGQLVYETEKKNAGWDGTYRGTKQPVDTYIWVAEGIGMDGNRIKKRGSTILIR